MRLTRARRLLNRLAHPEADPALKQLRKDVRRLTERIESMQVEQHRAAALLKQVQRTSAQLSLITALNLRQQAEIAKLPKLLDEARIGAHIRAAVESAQLLTEPYEHAVVERVFPDDVYELLIRALPPAEFFRDRDPIKQNLTFPMRSGPTLAVAVWEYVDQVIAQRIIRPAVSTRFHDPLRRHFAEVFGDEFAAAANQLAQSAHSGRLMLRRPGYHLGPHRDPKRTMLTCLLYLARDGESEAYGTQIFRVHGDGAAPYTQTYYPEEYGLSCELVKVVPFKPNTMLVSLNSRGAHGALIPADAPSDLERYTYQFYVGPDGAELGEFIKALPPPYRSLWRDKATAAG